MTSSSRARAVLLAGIAAAAVLGVARADSPAPALAAAPRPAQRTLVVPKSERVVIKAVTMQALSGDDSKLLNLFSAQDRESLREPVLISVQVAGGFGNLARNASPVIVLNGQPVPGSHVPRGARDRVEAVVRDGRALRDGASIQVGWFGALERTLSAPSQANLQ